MIDLLSELLRDPISVAQTLPAIAIPLIVLVSAWLEFVVPPYPGDTVLLLGFFLAGQEVVPLGMIFLSALLGSILGSISAYGIGYRFGLDILLKLLGRRRGRKISREDIERPLERFGERVLLFNRFLPFVRGFMLFTAGALRMSFAKVVVYASLGNVAFVAFLMMLGVFGADSWEQMVEQARGVKIVLGIALIVCFLAWWWRRRDPRQELRRTLF